MIIKRERLKIQGAARKAIRLEGLNAMRLWSRKDRGLGGWVVQRRSET